MVKDQRTLVVRTGEGRSLPVGASTVRLLALGSDTADRSSVEELMSRQVSKGRPHTSTTKPTTRGTWSRACSR